MRTPLVVYALATGCYMPLRTTKAPTAITAAAMQATMKVFMVRSPCFFPAAVPKPRRERESLGQW